MTHRNIVSSPSSLGSHCQVLACESPVSGVSLERHDEFAGSFGDVHHRAFTITSESFFFTPQLLTQRVTELINTLGTRSLFIHFQSRVTGSTSLWKECVEASGLPLDNAWRSSTLVAHIHLTSSSVASRWFQTKGIASPLGSCQTSSTKNVRFRWQQS